MARVPPFALVGIYHEWQVSAGSDCVALLPGGLDRTLWYSSYAEVLAYASVDDKSDPAHSCTRTRTSGKRSSGKHFKHPPSRNPGYAPTSNHTKHDHKASRNPHDPSIAKKTRRTGSVRAHDVLGVLPSQDSRRAPVTFEQ